MDASERIQRLTSAGVSEEEAAAALRAAEGDLLEAVLLLERQGRLPPPAGGGFYSTGGEAGPAGGRPPAVPPGAAREERQAASSVSFPETLRHLLRRGMDNGLEIWRRGEQIAFLPLLILLFLLVFFFWIIAVILAAGLVLGFRFRPSGPDLDRNFRETAAKAAEWVENLAGALAARVREFWRRCRDAWNNHKRGRS